MRVPWDKSKVEQLDLVDEASAVLDLGPITAPADEVVDPQRGADVPDLSLDACRPMSLFALTLRSRSI